MGNRGMSSFNFDLLPATLDLPDAVTGDTFPGLAVTSVTFDDGQAPNALTKLEIAFRRQPSTSGDAELKLSSADGKITIDDPAAWKATVAPFSITLGAGTWCHDWEFTDAAGTVRTLLAGTWRLVQDVTR